LFFASGSNFSQCHRGLIISHKKTLFSTLATATRLIIIIAFLGWAVYSESLTGIVASSLAWTGGIGIEGIMVFLGVVYLFTTPGRAAKKLPEVSNTDSDKLQLISIGSFFLPLAIMRFLRSGARPIIQC